MYKTTAKEYELFKSECAWWIEYFGLKGWEWNYVHEKTNDSFAEYWVSVAGKCCTITFTKELGGEKKEYADDWIEKSAFHEVCEIMLSRLNGLIIPDRMACKDDIEEITHELIRIFENTVYRDIMKLRKN